MADMNNIINNNNGGSPRNYIDFYGDLNMENWTIRNAKLENVINATSAASYALMTTDETESYSDPTSKTLTNIYGVQSLTNGDVRWSDKQTYFTSEWEDGIYECYIEIPWWIAQNIELDYHVNITPANGFFQYYVSERDPYYFIVRSDKDSMGFTFELVATLLERNTTDNNAIIANNSVITDTSTDEVTPFQMPNNN